MRYCKKCVMPDTRPGIKFNEAGICSACVAYEKQKDVDWNARFKELEVLCEKYRGINGSSYDCMIAVSGGKDSHYQVYVMKELLNMTPLLVSVEDNFTMTEAGKSNIRNISEEFSCDIITIKPNIKIQKNLTRKTFERYLKPTWYIDRLIYTYPLHMASKFNLPLLVYGENISYTYGGEDAEDTPSAKKQVNNGVASEIPISELIDDEVKEKELSLLIPPTEEEMDKLEPIYLSYFVPWNSYKNYSFAKKRGFRDLVGEWRRTNHVEDYDQIDSMAYLVHPWLKYPKFGHAFGTDMASRLVRYGMITRDEAIELVEEHDHNLDFKILQDYVRFAGYSISEFWKIVDKFYNRELFEKDEFGNWKLKNKIPR